MSEISTQFSHLSNDELRQELTKNGIAYGPIMASTRKVYEKKLQNMLEGNVLNLNGSAENGNGMSLNGNASNGLRTPSRETSHEKSPMVKLGLQQQEGTPQKDGQREKSPNPLVDDDSDNEEDTTTESTRVLSPDEMRTFRFGLHRRYTDSPANDNNGSAANGGRMVRREVSVQPEDNKNSGGSLLRIADGQQKNRNNKAVVKRYGIPAFVLVVVGGLFAAAFQMRDYLPPMAMSMLQSIGQIYGGGPGYAGNAGQEN